jgi:alkylhydroperoxidase family enzyme
MTAKREFTAESFENDTAERPGMHALELWQREFAARRANALLPAILEAHKRENAEQREVVRVVASILEAAKDCVQSAPETVRRDIADCIFRLDEAFDLQDRRLMTKVEREIGK